MFKLKEIREYEDYSLAEIAQKIHVSKSSYADWESARAVIPLKHMVSLANVYHISLDYLFGLTDLKQYKNSKIMSKVAQTIENEINKFFKDKEDTKVTTNKKVAEEQDEME